MITCIHISREIFAIDVLTALKFSMEHRQKHVLRLLSLVSITRQMPRPRHKNKSDYKVEQSSFTLIALFWLEIGRCRGCNWLDGNQAIRLYGDHALHAVPSNNTD